MTITNSPKKDISGKKFGALTAIEYVGSSKWLCKCDCGDTKIQLTWLLNSLPFPSCGCRTSELNHKKNVTHGMSGSREYKTWQSMIRRCENKKCREYRLYGARGIIVCKRWRDSFEEFFRDMGPRPSQTHSIDRVDNNGNYEPGNCRWAIAKEQARNTRRNKRYNVRGQMLTLVEACERLGLRYNVMNLRINRGMSFEDAVEKPLYFRLKKETAERLNRLVKVRG